MITLFSFDDLTWNLGKLIFLSLADTYEAAGDSEGAAAVLERALKKHKKSKKVWMRYCILILNMMK